VRTLQPAEVPLARAWAQVQDQRGDAARPRLRDGPHGGVELLGRVGEVRQHGGHQHTVSDAGVGERAAYAEPGLRCRGPGLDVAPHLPVHRPDRHVNGDVGDLGRLAQQVEVAQHERALGEDRERVRGVAQRGQDPRHQPVPALGALVAVDVGPHRDVLARPPRPGQLHPHQLRRGHLHDHLRVEVLPGVEIEVLVGVASEAVVRHHTVRDEVAGAGRDVVHRNVDAQICHGHHR